MIDWIPIYRGLPKLPKSRPILIIRGTHNGTQKAYVNTVWSLLRAVEVELNVTGITHWAELGELPPLPPIARRG